MCCNLDQKATKQTQLRIRPFTGYKVVSVRKKIVRSIMNGMQWKQGTNKAHKTSRRYKWQHPHGIHFFLKKEDAQQYRKPFIGAHVIALKVNPKDIIAVEKRNTGFRQGVALKVTVTQPVWNGLQKQME